jgi:hypothetical protein
MSAEGFDALMAARFKTSPWAHQYTEFEKHVASPARALIWQMRTGKTKMTLDTAASHWEHFRDIDALVIFAPNGVHANWIEREIPLHMWAGVDFEAMAWRTRVAGLKGGNQLSKADKAAWEEVHASWWSGFWRAVKGSHFAIFSFNSESMIRDDIRRALANILHRRRVMMVWDESTDFRTPGSIRTRMSRALARKTVVRRILDGTMLHNSPLHAFAQFELLERAALGFQAYESYKNTKGQHIPGFLQHFAEFELERRGRNFVPVITGLRNADELRERIAGFSSVVLRSDCVDLPSVVPERRKIPLSAEQERVYREVQKQTKIEVERGEVVGINAQAAKVGKLQQVVGGWLIDEDGTRHKLRGPNPRLEQLSEDVYMASGKVLVWVQFRHEIEEVVTRLRKDGWEVLEYHGGVSDEDKAYVRVRFPEEKDKIVVVGQPQSGGRGVELPASVIIWYSHTNNTIIRAQADERATVMGGGDVKLIDYQAPGVDGYMLDRLANNMSIADDIAGRGLKAVLRQLELGD